MHYSDTITIIRCRRLCIEKRMLLDMAIETRKFEHVYKQLLYIAHREYPDCDVSFTTGMWEHEEGYKRDFWADARDLMELDTWPSNQNDYGYIVSKAVQPFGVLMKGSHRQQNLVSSQNYNKWLDIMWDNTEESAAALYSIFFGDDDEAAFRRISKLLSRRALNDPISIASMYFFLKDKEQYVTARKRGTGECLSKLGVNASCLQKCTWEGYQQYLSTIRELREMLLPFQPETTLLDAQSFLWMLRQIEPDTPEYKEALPRILFCNISWMETYDTICFPEDKPRYGGSYVTNTGDAFESLNFHQYTDGYFGFVETGYAGGTATRRNAKQIHIEKIDPDATGDYVDGVTVVFCAYSDELNKTVIVGWYTNATVLRYREEHYDGHVYNIKANDAVILPEILRTKEFPRARGGQFGFGQSNVKFASGEGADDVVKETIRYINSFGSEEDLTIASEKAMAALTDEKLAELAESIPAAPAPVFTRLTKQRKRNPYLPEQAKRRANGICQLCGNKLDYYDSSGRPYLEAHHVIPLADDGIDELGNIVALCPNCHKRMHIVKDPDDIEFLLSTALE